MTITPLEYPEVAQDGPLARVAVVVDGSVQEAVVISAAQLQPLARYLCQEREAHDIGLNCSCKDTDYTSFEIEQKKNGGYCNKCLNLAGNILVEFSVKERTK